MPSMREKIVFSRHKCQLLTQVEVQMCLCTTSSTTLLASHALLNCLRETLRKSRYSPANPHKSYANWQKCPDEWSNSDLNLFYISLNTSITRSWFQFYKWDERQMNIRGLVWQKKIWEHFLYKPFWVEMTKMLMFNELITYWKGTFLN